MNKIKIACPSFSSLAVLALLLLLTGCQQTGESADAVISEPPAASVEQNDTQASIPSILERPANWVGREFAGEVTVAEVPTDRGFWIEDDGARMFAILVDEPSEQPTDINQGQRIRIREAKVHDKNRLSDLPGKPVDEKTKQIVQDQAVFLVVQEEQIQILEPSQDQQEPQRRTE